MTTEQAIGLQLTSILAIVISPVIAVIITLWYQDRKEKRQQKLRTFFTLIAFRNSIPLHQDFVNCLNTIDIVFYDSPKVIQAWKKFYEILHEPEQTVDKKHRGHLKLDLLSEIASSLGYKNLRQTDIDKFYIPIVHVDHLLHSSKIQSELLAFLQNSNMFYENLAKRQLEDEKAKQEN